MNILFGAIFAGTIILDQILKSWAMSVLRNSSDIKILGDFLGFSYVENKGAAFGMLQNQTWFFVTITVIMLAIMLYIFLVNKKITKLSRLSLVLIAGGAIGNLIDRVRLRFVVDFIHVRFGNFYDFPVFNAADSFVVVGTFLLIILIFLNKFEKSDKINE